MRLPGDDIEHASYGDAGQRAVEATQSEVDGVKGRRESESWGRRQAERCVGSRGPTSPEVPRRPQPRQLSVPPENLWKGLPTIQGENI